MSIRRYKDGETELKVGQWVNLESNIIQTFCGRPLQVCKTSPKGFLDNEGEVHARKGIVFVSDTQVEAESMWLLSKQRSEALKRAVAKVREEYNVLIEENLRKDSS